MRKFSGAAKSALLFILICQAVEACSELRWRPYPWRMGSSSGRL